MIRIAKPADGPDVLSHADGAGHRETASLKDRYEHGERGFTFHRRVYAHEKVKSLLIERPLFVHPTLDDPQRFITFNQHVAVPVRNSRRGRSTIDSLGLNRAELADRRREHLARISLLHKARLQLEERNRIKGTLNSQENALLNRLRSHLRKEGAPTSEYSSMVQAFLK